jgi:hypothetical protein
MGKNAYPKYFQGEDILGKPTQNWTVFFFQFWLRTILLLDFWDIDLTTDRINFIYWFIATRYPKHIFWWKVWQGPRSCSPTGIRALDNFSTRGVCHIQCARAMCIWLSFTDFGDRRKHFLTNFKYF